MTAPLFDPCTDTECSITWPHSKGDTGCKHLPDALLILAAVTLDPKSLEEYFDRICSRGDAELYGVVCGWSAIVARAMRPEDDEDLLLEVEVEIVAGTTPEPADEAAAQMAAALIAAVSNEDFGGAFDLWRRSTDEEAAGAAMVLFKMAAAVVRADLESHGVAGADS